MSTAQELIRDAKSAIAGMGDDLDAIQDFTRLICVLLAAPDLEEECPGLHRLVMVIREHLDDVRDQHRLASSALGQLANP